MIKGFKQKSFEEVADGLFDYKNDFVNEQLTVFDYLASKRLGTVL